MALSIKDPVTEQLARDLARQTGESITMATRHALEERLRRISDHVSDALLAEELAAIRQRWSAIPAIDKRTPDEIIGYDENGLPS
jgi:antitoxin VapB